MTSATSYEIASSSTAGELRFDLGHSNGGLIGHFVALNASMTVAVVEVFGQLDCAVAESAERAAFLERDDLHHPGCVITTLPEDDMDEDQLPQVLIRLGSPLKVIYLADQPQVRTVVAAFRNGADDVILWPQNASNLRKVVARAFASSRAESIRVAEFHAAQMKLSRLTTARARGFRPDLGRHGEQEHRAAFRYWIANGRGAGARRSSISLKPVAWWQSALCCSLLADRRRRRPGRSLMPRSFRGRLPPESNLKPPARPTG